MPFTGSDIIKIICAIFLPPVGVALERGIGADFCINILLTILGASVVDVVAVSRSKRCFFFFFFD